MTTENDTPQGRTFDVETRFQMMAVRAGGVPRIQAIEQAEAEIGEIKPGFDSWFDSELKEFQNAVARIRAGTVDPDWLDDAGFRSRELRDSAAVLGIALVAFIAQSLCEALTLMEPGADCSVDAISCHIDALVLARQEAYRELTPDQVPDLTEGLRRVVSRLRANRERRDESGSAALA